VRMVSLNWTWIEPAAAPPKPSWLEKIGRRTWDRLLGGAGKHPGLEQEVGQGLGMELR